MSEEAGGFAPRISVEEVEEGRFLSPRFDAQGLIPCVTCDATNNEVLMLGWMNAEALRLSIESGEAHYFSRSRQALWKKGETSGFVHRIVEMRIDDDQDALVIKVSLAPGHASCHVGYRSCFYRSVPLNAPLKPSLTLRFIERTKQVDPVAVYGDLPNPTRL